MTDWTAAIGTGTILLRDTGSSAEFWLTAGNGTAFDYGLTWSGVVNGVGVGGTFRYNAGSGYQLLGAWGVSYSQTVSFTKTQNSGSSGLGGPATVSGYFARSTIPDPPTQYAAEAVLPTSFNVRFGGNGNGGSAIDYYLVRIGLSNPPTAGAYTDYVNYSGTQAITGLIPGTQYYTMVYAHNGNGYSNYSNVVATKTPAPMRVKIAGVWKYAIPYVKVAGVWKMAEPYVKVAGVWKKTT